MQALDDYISTADGLARLRAHAGRLLKLQKIYAAIVPDDYLAESSQVANYQQGKLTISADSGSVAARLRQLLPSLRQAFEEAGVDVTEICVKVQPRTAIKKPVKLCTAASVSHHSVEDLGTLMESLPEKSPLRGALQRFVRRCRIS